eukprot:CAMPEP_0172194588 /NCGR_PEP_ID=MMETSP1050-20130122/25666_1 /TAXON_ID=233186 /ORGANISM="Cryptomonas curvata, Strain CCAP979/52" /LENGTH=176 /DNA_ID=CAMNT_0012870417 /DNA_START=490 /DNA_END=1017 /DNA_ORIENTATION=+
MNRTFNLQEALISEIGFVIASDKHLLNSYGHSHHDIRKRHECQDMVYAGLALFLLHESRNVRSKWRSLLCSLPKIFSFPTLMTEEEVSDLLSRMDVPGGGRGTGLRESVETAAANVRSLVRDSHRHVILPLLQRYPHLFSADHYGLSAWAWALGIVWSRAWPLHGARAVAGGRVQR